MSNNKARRRTSIPALGLLTWRPMSGYELKTQIEGSLANFWSESFGQLYPQLAALEADGLIEVDSEDHSGKRSKKVYKITDAGRTHLADWLDDAPRNRPPRDELLMKVFFTGEGDISSVIQHVRTSQHEAEVSLKKYQAIDKDLSAMVTRIPKARFWLMTVRNGIQHSQTHIKWCAQTLTELNEIKGNSDETD